MPRIFRERSRLAVQRLLAPCALLFQRPDVRRQQPVQSEQVALFFVNAVPLLRPG